MKKTFWLILVTFALGTVATVPAMAAPAHAHGKSALHQTAKKKGKHGKKHHKKHKSAKKHRK